MSFYFLLHQIVTDHPRTPTRPTSHPACLPKSYPSQTDIESSGELTNASLQATKIISQCKIKNKNKKEPPKNNEAVKKCSFMYQLEKLHKQSIIHKE